MNAPNAAREVVRLPAGFGIEDASALHAALAPLLDQPGPVVLDAPEASRVHAAALQVLTAFVRGRAAAGHAIEWQGRAGPLLEAAARLGLTSTLGLG